MSNIIVDTTIAATDTIDYVATDRDSRPPPQELSLPWLGFCANTGDENSVTATVVEMMILRMMWAPSSRPKPEKLD
jgi:hypothetical protein